MKFQRLTLDEALAFHQSMEGDALPATLSPCYVQADATRDRALQPAFVAVEAGAQRWLHGFHITDIPGSDWRDASSPYGYGGPVSNTADAGFLAAAWALAGAHLREERVAVEYLRFHPLLGNESGYTGQVAPNRQVVDIDLAVDFSATYPLRLQQVLRKAERAALRYEEAAFAPSARAFGAYHRAAMRSMDADAFYVFEDSYFHAMGLCGSARLAVVTAADAGAPTDAAQWLAAALLLDGPGVREYHLAATVPEGRRMGASSWLLHRAAQAARDAGRRHFYLGGGTDASPDNPLLFFKGGFSPLRLPYRTGWQVHDTQAYESLKALFPAQHAAHPQRPIFHRKV